jgi:hypothetical protein
LSIHICNIYIFKIPKFFFENFQIQLVKTSQKKLAIFKLLRTTKLENQIYALGKNLIPGMVLVCKLPNCLKVRTGTKDSLKLVRTTQHWCGKAMDTPDPQFIRGYLASSSC